MKYSSDIMRNDTTPLVPLRKKSHMVKLYGSTQHSVVYLLLAKIETPTFSTYFIYFDKIFSVIIHLLACLL